MKQNITVTKEGSVKYALSKNTCLGNQSRSQTHTKYSRKWDRDGIKMQKQAQMQSKKNSRGDVLKEQCWRQEPL
jgi:hypothetical protein